MTYHWSKLKRIEPISATFILPHPVHNLLLLLFWFWFFGSRLSYGLIAEFFFFFRFGTAPDLRME